MATEVGLEEAYDLLRLSGSFGLKRDEEPAAKSSSPPPTPSEKIITPTSNDILMGRGKHSQTHPGNQKMLKLVEKHRDQYIYAQRKEKGVLVVELLDKIRSSGARFLKRRENGSADPHGSDQEWEEVSRRDTYEKLCHALRTKTKNGVDEGDDSSAESPRQRSDKCGEKPTADEQHEPKPTVVPREIKQRGPRPSETSSESQPKGTSANCESVSPEAADILIGCDGYFRSHPGNLKINAILEMHREEYNKGKRKERSALIKDILLEIRSTGARILILQGGIMKNKDSSVEEGAQSWEIAGRGEAYDIIRNMFRMRQRQDAKDAEKGAEKVKKSKASSKKADTQTAQTAKTPSPPPALEVRASHDIKKDKKDESQDPPQEAGRTKLRKPMEPKSTENNQPSHQDIPSPQSKIRLPSSDDILMGRGRHAQTHPGNLKMLRLVDQYRESYNIGQRKRKGEIVREILNIIRSSGARFVKRQQASTEDLKAIGEEYWEEATPAEVHEKLCHALRTKTRPISDDVAGPVHVPRKHAKAAAVSHKKGRASLERNIPSPPSNSAALTDVAISMAVHEYLLRKQEI